MWNEIIIKAGSIQNLTEARYFSSKLIELVGFNFDQASGNAIEPIQAQQIIGWLEGPKIVAEFGTEPKSKIQEITTVLGIETIKIPFARKAEFQDTSLHLILQSDFSGLPKNIDAADLLQVKFNEDDLSNADFSKLLQQNKVILETDWTEDNLQEIQALQPYGINFNGSGELKTGVQSFEEMDVLFELMEDEF